MSEAEVVTTSPLTARAFDNADLVPTLAYTPALMKKIHDDLREFVDAVMKKDVDYGPAFPGSDKLTLYKAGGEKLAEIYGYSVRPICTRRIEIWTDGPSGDPTLPNGPFFQYEFEAEVYSKRTGNLIGRGFGSCNSRENRYRWRQGARACPECGVEGAIIKGRAEYGGGWLCFGKKGGCGAKFKGEDAKLIEEQEAGRVANDDIATQVNTILKMAKKRAYLDAIISVTQSAGIFTPEDDDGGDEGASAGGNRRSGDAPAGKSTPTGKTKVVVAGKEIFTAGANQQQTMRVLSIIKDFEKKHGEGSHRAALKQLVGVEDLEGLTEALAESVINMGLPAPSGAATAQTAAPTTGQQQELGAGAKDSEFD